MMEMRGYGAHHLASSQVVWSSGSGSRSGQRAYVRVLACDVWPVACGRWRVWIRGILHKIYMVRA
jgi:hypothetical protein